MLRFWWSIQVHANSKSETTFFIFINSFVVILGCSRRRHEVKDCFASAGSIHLPEIWIIKTSRDFGAHMLEPWWRHQMEVFSALLALCAGNSPVPTQRPVTRSFDVFVELRLNQQLSKQWRRRWFETPSRSLWRHCAHTRSACGRSLC